METAVRGANLSGGFGQSIALARVFLRKQSQIVILDEALSKMDGIKKRELILPRLFQFVRKYNMTLILISHDLSTVCPLVEKVLVLENGRLVQQGSHTELAAQQGQPYARLLGRAGGLGAAFN